MPERTIDARGVSLAACDDGEGIPVVLLHGLTASRRYVVMGSRSLQRSGHRVVAFDARGHGASSPAPSPQAYG
ncbi:MAG: alpha/beta fold hydrolase, partial [Solirubrobacteraceae bacterium]